MATNRGSPRQCANCVYACPLQDGARKLLVCANTPDVPGGLVGIEPESACPNFRAKRGPVVRLDPPEPPNDEIRYIPLTKGKFAIVDAADYEWLSQYKWHVHGDDWNGFYAARRLRNGKQQFMHRAIMNPPAGMVVDHIDGNRSDNRRANLRICTQRQNTQNSRPARGCTSRFKGVSYHRAARKWIVLIKSDGKRIYLGLFDDEIEAAKAYDRKAHELFGEFAYLNFPEDYA